MPQLDSRGHGLHRLGSVEPLQPRMSTEIDRLPSASEHQGVRHIFADGGARLLRSLALPLFRRCPVGVVRTHIPFYGREFAVLSAKRRNLTNQAIREIVATCRGIEVVDVRRFQYLANAGRVAFG